jgi:hypothetical protein
MANFNDSSWSALPPLWSSLLQSPTEILTAVLQWLDDQDILNLRLSCRRLHVVVHSSAQHLYAAYSGHLRSEHGGLRHAEEQVDNLMSYLSLRRRHADIAALARVLSDHLIAKLTIQASSDKAADANMRLSKAATVRRVLFPYLFNLDVFLENLQRVITEAEEAFADWDNETYVSAHDVFLLDQQHLISGMCAKAGPILGISAVHSLMMGVCKAKSLGPRARSSTYPFASIKRLMLERGLSRLTLILAEEDHQKRLATFNRTCELLVKRDRPELHILPTIHHLDVRRDFRPAQPSRRPSKIVEKFYDRQDIWQKAAFAVLQRDFGSEFSEHSDSTDDWLMSAITTSGDPVLALGDWRVP